MQKSPDRGPAHKSVLVLDGMWNKSLAAVRSLGKRGLQVTAGEKTRFATALFSKYCRRRVIYPSPTERTGDFLDWLEAELKEHAYDMVLPTELSTQMIITSHIERLSRFCKIPFADAALCSNVRDKAFVMDHARRQGIDIPETFVVNDLSQLHGLEKELTFPAVIKPRDSSGSRGIVYVQKRGDFTAAYHNVHRRYAFPIVQDYIPKGGDAIGVCLLLNYRSEVKASFVYKRLREYPVGGGPSTLRESIVRDDVLSTARALMEGLKWTGVAHVEFRVDPRDGKAKLLEINPRFWGSLQLAVLSGVDFPYLLYELAMTGDTAPVHCYRTGIKCRWLIPGDILHFISNPDRFRIKPGFLSRSNGDDILSLDDPMPVVGRILSVLPLLYKADMRHILFR